MTAKRARTVLLLLGLALADARILSKPAAEGEKKLKKPHWYENPPALSKAACRALYIATSLNPILSVIDNDYTGIFYRRRNTVQRMPVVDQLYGWFFYFARLKPRLLFVIGACLRALCVCTVIELVFDPPIGVGAGLNLLALGVQSQWPSPLVLGWTVSKPAWRVLRAAPPGDVRVPIQMTMPGMMGRWMGASAA